MPTPAFNKDVNSVNAPEAPVICLQIDHPELSEPIRVVNDANDIDVNGDTFTACAFNLTIPDQPQSGLPQGQLTVDNVGKEMMFWLEESNGARGATATILLVRRSDPDTIEMQQTLFIKSIVATQSTIQGTLSLDDILNRACMPLLYSPTNAPGLF